MTYSSPMQSVPAGCRAPEGYAEGDVLSFNVFVSASLTDQDFREPVDLAATLVNNRNPRAKLITHHFDRDAATPARGDVQGHINGSMLAARDAHVVVAVLARRAGEGTRQEILEALEMAPPHSALFVFYGAHAIPGRPGRTLHQIQEDDAERSSLIAFVAKVESFGESRGEHGYCIPFGNDGDPDPGRSLQNAVWIQLDNYVRLWLAQADAARKPAVASTAGPPPRAVPRYLGLSPYARVDSDDFFGRQAEIERFSRVLADPRLQALHLRGASGVGKSSFVIAGLLPRLGAAGGGPAWNSLYFKPGDDPFVSLARIIDLRRPGARQVGEEGQRRLAERMAADEARFVAELVQGIGPRWGEGRRVLYVDQLEELLVDDGDKELRDRRVVFVDRLRAFLAADPAHVLVSSIRTDRDAWLEDRRWRALRGVLSAGKQDWLDVPEEGEGLEQIVRGPAVRAGFGIDPLFLKALRLDIQGVASWTPLVSATLEEIVDHWQQRDPAVRVRELTLKDYEAVGGLRSVIARRAGSVMEALTDAERREVLPRVFSLLVKLDDSGRPTRRRFAMSQLSGLDAERALIDRLVDSRLLVNEGEVELVHDVLFEEWEDLARWRKEHSDDLDELTDLEHQARRWDRRNRSETLLLPEKRLERAEAALASLPVLVASNPLLSEFMSIARASSRREALLKAIEGGDLERLVHLQSEGVRLEPKQVQALGTRDAFYYALFPDRTPTEAEAAGRSGAAAFNEAVGQDGDGLSARLGWFTAERVHDRRVNKSFSVAHYAALGGRVELLEHLLAVAPALLQAPSDQGSTPFQAAAYGGSRAAVEWFIERGLLLAEEGIDMPNEVGRTALWFAASMGNEDVVETLLANRADPNRVEGQGWSVLHSAIYYKRTRVAEKLLEVPGLDLTARAPGGQTPLLLACQAPESGIALLLLDRVEPAVLGFDLVGDTGWTALGTAISRPPTSDSTQIVRKLLEKGAAPDLPNGPDAFSPLYLAANWGGREAVAALLAQGGVDANASGNRLSQTALLTAVQQGHQEVVRELLQHPEVDVDRIDGGGFTPLLIAAARGDLELVNALLARGANAARVLGRHGSIVRAALAGTDEASRLVRGQIAERLLEHGAPMPVWHQLERDEAGRVAGLGPRPEAEIEGWFLDRLSSTAAETPALAPLLAGDWRWVETRGAAALLARAAAADLLEELELRDLRLHAVRSVGLALDQPAELAELVVTTQGGEAGAVTLLSSAGLATRIDGRSPRLHKLNADLGRRLTTSGQALDYLRLFCGAITAEGGTFRIFDHPDQLLPRPEMSEEERERLGALAASPAPVEGPAARQGEDTFSFEALILYAGHVFRARMQVRPEGMVEMFEDEPIEEGALPVYSHMFENGIRFVRASQPSREAKP